MVTEELTAFLTQIDTAFLATASADGEPYVQHRGGPKGFIRALDDRTLGFLDLAGNRQYLTVGNLRDNDRVLLFLIDYAHRKRVKVWGTAKNVPLTDELRAKLAVPRGRPESAILIAVTRWDINCPAHIPQKLDASDVKEVVARYEARIAAIGARNAELEAHSAALEARNAALQAHNAALDMQRTSRSA
jgi:uncharacterized protein